MGGGEEKNNVCEALDATLQRLFNLLASLPERFQLQQKVDFGKKFAVDHPMMTLFIVVSLALGCVPLMCFFAFACGSLFLTFTGFLFVEGFLLTVGGVLLGGVMCIMGFLSLGLSIFLALSWLAFNSASRLMVRTRDRVQQSKTSRAEPTSTSTSSSSSSSLGGSYPPRPSDVEIVKDSGQEKGE